MRAENIYEYCSSKQLHTLVHLLFDARLASSLSRVVLVVVLQVRSSTNYHDLIGDFILFSKEYVQSKQLEISNIEVLLTVLGLQAYISRCLRLVATYAMALRLYSRKGLHMLPPEQVYNEYCVL